MELWRKPGRPHLSAKMGRRYKLTVSGKRDAQYGPYCTELYCTELVNVSCSLRWPGWV